jgi:uncharacterized protein
MTVCETERLRLSHLSNPDDAPCAAVTLPPAQAQTITIDDTQRVSALLLVPRTARACFVMAHGAGAGMEHPSMTALATGLSALNIATLRYQFPYMERGSRRPDPPQLCHATVRAAVAAAALIGG